MTRSPEVAETSPIAAKISLCEIKLKMQIKKKFYEWHKKFCLFVPQLKLEVWKHFLTYSK